MNTQSPGHTNFADAQKKTREHNAASQPMRSQYVKPFCTTLAAMDQPEASFHVYKKVHTPPSSSCQKIFPRVEENVARDNLAFGQLLGATDAV